MFGVTRSAVARFNAARPRNPANSRLPTARGELTHARMRHSPKRSVEIRVPSRSTNSTPRGRTTSLFQEAAVPEFGEDWLVDIDLSLYGAGPDCNIAITRKRLTIGSRSHLPAYLTTHICHHETLSTSPQEQNNQHPSYYLFTQTILKITGRDH